MKKKIAHEALIILMVIALLTLICRLWPILLLVIIGIIIVVVRMVFISAKEPEVKEPPAAPTVIPRTPTEADVKNLAYSVILRRVTELVTKDFPDARWIWEAPDVRKMIEESDEIYILLNRAGGYRRAKIKLANLQVLGIEYQTNQTDNSSENESDSKEKEALTEDEEMEENYELLAFEWVDAHIMELNERCNDAIAQGVSELLISADDLPVRESWEDICFELQRADISSVKCIQEGIKINLMQ